MNEKEALVGLNQAECAALLRFFEDMKEFSDHAKELFEVNDTPPGYEDETREWWIGRLIAKLQRALPVLRFFTRMPVELESDKKMYGPFATDEARITEAAELARVENWIGLVMIDVPLHKDGVVGGTETVWDRKDLETYWRNEGEDFVSMYDSDNNAIIPPGADPDDKVIRSFLTGAKATYPDEVEEEDYDWDF